MSESTPPPSEAPGAAPAAPDAPPAAPDAPSPDVALAEALKELGIEPDEAGRIPVAEHSKLVTTVKALREQVKAHEAATRKSAEEAEKARLESLSEQERAVEEARKAGYEAALAEQREVVIRSQVTAAAAAANFADPADAATMLGDLKALADEKAVAAAVAKLAESKPYLLKPAVPAPSLEQGPRGTARPGTGGGDFLADAIRRRRAG